MILIGCGREVKDKAIKADITTKAKTEISFAGVNYIVDKGVVTLSGLCPSIKAKDKVESTVKKIAGVKEVVNSIAIGPVVIDSDPLLKQSVDSVLMKYKSATAQMSNNNVVLSGEVQSDELPELLEALQKLPVSSITNQLTVAE